MRDEHPEEREHLPSGIERHLLVFDQELLQLRAHVDRQFELLKYMQTAHSRILIAVAIGAVTIAIASLGVAITVLVILLNHFVAGR